MSLAGIITGGLLPGASGVNYIPVRGLTAKVLVLYFRFFAGRKSSLAMGAIRDDYRMEAVRKRFSLKADTDMSVVTDFSFTRGTDAYLEFTLPISEDVTGRTLVFSMSETAGGTTTVVKTAEVTSPNVFRFRLNAADTVGLTPRKYVYDVWDRDSGNNAPLAEGKITLAREVVPYP